MGLLIVPAGLALLAVALTDLVQTTMGAQRAGWLARHAAQLMWMAFRLLRRLAGPPVHRYCGTFMMAFVIVLYLVLHWIAWTLIFTGGEGTLDAAGEPTGLGETAVFVAAAMSTMGSSTIDPASPGWDLASALVAANGLVVLTLTMTFVVNITDAVAAGRAFAVLVSTRDVASETHFDDFEQRLAELTTAFNAFPLALYFSSPVPARRAERAIAKFVAEGMNERNVARLRPILAALPGVTAEGDIAHIRQEVNDWAGVYMLHRPQHWRDEQED
jgi:hypothetical protein